MFSDYYNLDIVENHESWCFNENNCDVKICTITQDFLHYTVYCGIEHSYGNCSSNVGYCHLIKNKELQTNNTTFLINLLFADVGAAVLHLCTYGPLVVLYLLDGNINVDCRVIMIPIMILVIASRLMFFPMCVDQFIHIAFQFSHKRIVTTKAIIISIITLWVVAMGVATLIYTH